MNLADVMDEVASKLEAISGLRVHAWTGAAVVPPAAMVAMPEDMTYDQTYRRGMDRMTLPVVVVVGRPSDRSARDLLAQYIDGSGSTSVKATLDSATYTSCDTVRVTSAEIGGHRIAGTDYLGATFMLDITGQGA